MDRKWHEDIWDMHFKFGVHQWIMENLNDKEKMSKFLEFRMNFLREELNETQTAIDNKDPQEIVDGLIDLCVVAIGTLDAFGIQPQEAWDTVHKANMSKQPGVKESRPNPLGLPDLIKPEGWEGPNHDDNIGFFAHTL
jgi:predicted HAD superfamily Cof-like phosphohydrolase